jgi:uncharacterized protein (TIGR00725 family)
LTEDDPEYGEARRLGELLSRRGWSVVTGGYDGAMAAVSRGVRQGGGHTVGITMSEWEGRLVPNEWLAEVRPAEDLFARLRQLMVADAWLAVAGGIGTLSEVALAWNLLQTREVEPRPLVLVGPRWRAIVAEIERTLVVGAHDLALVRTAETAEAAVDMIS